jgi:hypothetical protein
VTGREGKRERGNKKGEEDVKQGQTWAERMVGGTSRRLTRKCKNAWMYYARQIRSDNKHYNCKRKQGGEVEKRQGEGRGREETGQGEGKRKRRGMAGRGKRKRRNRAGRGKRKRRGRAVRGKMKRRDRAGRRKRKRRSMAGRGKK